MLPSFQVAFCNVTLVDDGNYEDRETFSVRLGDASGYEWYGARVGDNDRVQVTITNDEDGKSSWTLSADSELCREG